MGINVEQVPEPHRLAAARLVKTVRVDRKDPRSRATRGQHLPGQRVQPRTGQLSAHLRWSGGRPVAGVRGAHGRPAFPGALAARLLHPARRFLGANDFHRRAAARRWVVLHPAGQRHPARQDDLLHVGVVSDRSGGHPPPGRDALGAAAGRPAGTEVDEGVRRRRVQAVRGVGHPHRAARPSAPTAGQGGPAAGVVPAPRSAARRPGAAHLRAGLHERSHPAGVGAGHPSRRARAPAGGLAGPCDVVHAGVPRRRVAALRPVLAVGVRRPRRCARARSSTSTARWSPPSCRRG